MKIKVQVPGYASSDFELSEDDAKRLFINSIERVINTAISVCESSVHIDADVAATDLGELKQIMVRLWTSGQSAIYASKNDMRE